MDVWQHIWQVLAALAGTVALIYVLALVARRMQQRVGSQGQQLQIIETLHLSTKERLLLVSVGQRQVLLGVTAQQITSLSDMPFDSAHVDPRQPAASADLSMQSLSHKVSPV